MLNRRCEGCGMEFEGDTDLCFNCTRKVVESRGRFNAIQLCRVIRSVNVDKGCVNDVTCHCCGSKVNNLNLMTSKNIADAIKAHLFKGIHE